MTQKNLGQQQGPAVLTALTMLLALGGVAQAAPDEAGPKPPAESETPPPPKVEPLPSPPVTASEADATPGLYIEHMGPDTFPGRFAAFPVDRCGSSRPSTACSGRRTPAPV